MKQVKIFFLVLTLLGFSSCSNEFDNYNAPNGGVYGTIVDVTTKEAVPLSVQGSTGTILKLMEQNTGASKSVDFYAKQDGTFDNSFVFNCDYTISVVGPFANVQAVNIKVKGQTEVDIPVTPYARIAATASASGKRITINYNVTKSDTNFSVSEVYGYWNFAPGVDDGTSNYAGKVVVHETTGTIVFDLTNDINYNNNLNKIKSNGNKIYIRVGAKTEGYVNYSKVIILVLE